MIPYCNMLACKPQVHFFVNLDIWAFGANGLNLSLATRGHTLWLCMQVGDRSNKGYRRKSFANFSWWWL